ncbi:MAG TPA: NnrS family protein [Gemmataceae bacterium]|nr:NnrS family protein [Gemmataceae bacterium]
MRATTEWITGRVLIPDLLRAAPQVRPVLDRYGLRGCGGPEGPAESLEFFARAHEVPLPALLEELRAAGAAPAPAPANGAGPADAIYRPFFKAGILVTLTAGAAWGAYLLWRIAARGSFTAAGLHEVNAHGHAQIFGWVGLFVMGFAYQAFPRFKHTSLSHPRVAFASLWLMLAGIAGRSVLEPLAGPGSWQASAAVAASALEVVAICLFAGVLAATWRQSGKPLAFYDWYVVSSLVWFGVQAVGETCYLAATLAAVERRQLLDLIVTWQGALRDVQIHGFALLMILGVSQRLFHPMYGLRAPSRRLSLAALACLNLAVAGEAAGLVRMHTAGRAWAGLWYASALLLTASVVALLCDWRIFRPAEGADRSLKFLRAAYVWLLLALALTLLMPVYSHVLLPRLAPESDAARLGFSHAWSGAARHAITVGFVSLMIVGVAARVVPTLNGVDARRLSALWLPFVLLNAGCALRVTAQVLTDFTPRAFPFAGASGVLEVTGLALWGGHLWLVMAGRPRLRRPARPPLPALAGGAPIEEGHRVGEVLDLYPALANVFAAFGFRPLANPFLRRTLAARVSVGEACRYLGVDPSTLLAALNAARPEAPSGRHFLPTPAKDCCPSCRGACRPAARSASNPT